MLKAIPLEGIEGSVTGFSCPGCGFVSMGVPFKDTPCVTAHRGQRLSAYLQAQLYGMLSDGIRPKDVAEKLGITVNTVYDYRRKFLNVR